MAVVTTPKHFLEAAYAKSTKNNPGQLATEATELFELSKRCLRKFYAVAARVNPAFFGTVNPVAAPGAGLPWPQPENAESVYYMEVAGTEVISVPHNDRQADTTRPAVFMRGRAYYSVGGTNDPDPSTDTLDLWCSKRPDDPADVDSVVDALWPESYNELVILEIAGELAKKDAGTTGRDIELQYIAGQRDEWLRLFIMFLEHETSNVVKRFHLDRINTATRIPLSDLLVGGSSVKL